MSFGFDNFVKQDKRFERRPYLSLMAFDAGFSIFDLVSIKPETSNAVSIMTHNNMVYNLQNEEYNIVINISEIEKQRNLHLHCSVKFLTFG